MSFKKSFNTVKSFTNYKTVILKYNYSEIIANLSIIYGRKLNKYLTFISSIINLKYLQVQDEAPKQHRDSA